MGYFAVNENDCIFRIETGRTGGLYSSIGCFGDEDTLIEIREAGAILDIECIYLGKMLHEPNLFLPDFREDPDLETATSPYRPDYTWGERNPCVVNLVRNRMELIFSDNLEKVCSYYVDGRLEYYHDDQDDLVFIRISDLTEEEYAFLE